MNDSRRSALVVGASGYLGSRTLSYLKRYGYDVYGSVRPGKTLTDCEQSKTLYLDLSQMADTELPTTFDVVVHCAAATSESTTDSGYSRKVNVDGTRNLISLCEKSGVRKLIYVSSMSAMPENPSAYAQTKLEAEGIVMRSKLRWVILRPGLITGDNPGGIFKKMENLIDKLPVVPIIGNNSSLATVRIEDLCEIIRRCIESDKANEKVIDACADEQLSLGDIVTYIAKQKSVRRTLIPIPYGFAMFVAIITKFIGKPIITTDNVHGLKHARRPNHEQLKSLLSFEPSTLNQKTRQRTSTSNGIEGGF